MDTVLSTDTPNAGRVKWNGNDNELQGNINTVSAALTTHKSSSDHDSRYYTETEIDAQQAAQDAALNTHKSSGDHDARYYTETEINSMLASRRFGFTFVGLLKSTFSSLSLDGIAGIELVTPRAGCLTAIGVKRISDSAAEVKTATYRSSGTTAQGRFSQGARIGFHRNTSTGANWPTVGGSAVNAAGLDSISIIDNVSDFIITIEGLYDTGDAIGGIG
jgi:hypothetical protein